MLRVYASNVNKLTNPTILNKWKTYASKIKSI